MKLSTCMPTPAAAAPCPTKRARAAADREIMHPLVQQGLIFQAGSVQQNHLVR